MSSRNIGFIQKKILYTYILNPILILPRLHIVFDHNDLSEGIWNSYKRSNLLLFLLWLGDG